MQKLFFCLPVFLLLLHPAGAQEYRNHAQLSQKLKSLEASSAGLAKLRSITKTAGGKDIWLMEVGSGDRSAHPAIAVVGGVEGSLLFSQELAVGFIEKLLAGAKTDSIKNLLATTTFYVYPSMSPDASEPKKTGTLPVTWNNGTMRMKQGAPVLPAASSGRRSPSIAVLAPKPSRACMTARCVDTAPLGWPVVPEV